MVRNMTKTATKEKFYDKFNMCAQIPVRPAELSDESQVGVDGEASASTGHLWELQEQVLPREMCLPDGAFISSL